MTKKQKIEAQTAALLEPFYQWRDRVGAVHMHHATTRTKGDIVWTTYDSYLVGNNDVTLRVWHHTDRGADGWECLVTCSKTTPIADTIAALDAHCGTGGAA